MARRHRRSLAAVVAFAVVGALALVAAPAAQAAGDTFTWTGGHERIVEPGRQLDWDNGTSSRSGRHRAFPAAATTKSTTNDLSDTSLSTPSCSAAPGYVVAGSPVDVKATGIAQTAAGDNVDLRGIAPSTANLQLPITIASGGTLTSGPLDRQLQPDEVGRGQARARRRQHVHRHDDGVRRCADRQRDQRQQRAQPHGRRARGQRHGRQRDCDGRRDRAR